MQLPKIHCAAFIAAFTLSLSGKAAEWSMEPGVSLRTGMDDNIRLLTEDQDGAKDTVWETSVIPRVDFGVKTETRGITGRADFAVRRFHGGSGLTSSNALDREDAHFDLNSFYSTSRNNLGFAFNFTRDSTLDSELDETGEAISSRATRHRYTLAPNWSHVLSERMRLNLDYRYVKIDYSDDPGVTNLTEYDYHVLSTSLVRMLSERISATALVSYSLYEPETNLDSKTLSVQGGLSREFSETLSASFLAGWRKTKSDQLIPNGFCVGTDPDAGFPECPGGIPVVTRLETDESDDNGSVFSFDINKKLYEGSLSASLIRQSTPSGRDGKLLDTTTLRVSADRRIKERLRASLTAQVTDRETITSTTSGIDSDSDNRKFYSISPEIIWKWRRDLDLRVTYRYRLAERDVTSDNATSNAFYITLNYRLPRLAVSR